jgi:hypothetical protein
VWQFFTLGKIFTAPVREKKKAIIARCRAKPPPSEEEFQALDAEHAILEEFSKSLAKLMKSHDDPRKTLHQAYDLGLGPPIPNHLVFTADTWEAYFRVDAVKRTAVGVYIRNTTDDPVAALSAILATFASMPGKPV